MKVLNLAHAMGFDLIDTLWNVKAPFASLSKTPDPDLIDTLWNVKGVCVVTDRRETV